MNIYTHNSVMFNPNGSKSEYNENFNSGKIKDWILLEFIECTKFYKFFTTTTYSTRHLQYLMYIGKKLFNKLSIQYKLLTNPNWFKKQPYKIIVNQQLLKCQWVSHQLLNFKSK